MRYPMDTCSSRFLYFLWAVCRLLSTQLFVYLTRTQTRTAKTTNRLEFSRPPPPISARHAGNFRASQPAVPNLEPAFGGIIHWSYGTFQSPTTQQVPPQGILCCQWTWTWESYEGLDWVDFDQKPAFECGWWPSIQELLQTQQQHHQSLWWSNKTLGMGFTFKTCPLTCGTLVGEHAQRMTDERSFLTN